MAQHGAWLHFKPSATWRQPSSPKSVKRTSWGTWGGRSKQPETNPNLGLDTLIQSEFYLYIVYIYIYIYVIIRAGLRVVPEWSYERQWEAHFSAQAQCFMTLVHL